VRALIVNAGSSSLKLRVCEGPNARTETRDGATSRAEGAGSQQSELGGEEEGDVVASEDLHAVDDSIGDALERFLDEAPAVDAAGHRVVHGGAEFERPILLDSSVDAGLSRLADLAPLHNPPALRAIHELRRLRPRLPQVVCFDTSFHAGMPARAATYALPARWRTDWGIRRFGFHGLSHAWASRRGARLLDQPVAATRLVTAHIGAGASLAAVDGGRSVDTTMGFSPIEGLVMATRSGSVDPAAVLLAVRRGLGPDAVESSLERESGLFGLCGSSDLREVIRRVDAGDGAASLAYDVYVHRLRASVAAMAVSLGRVDGLVFTGGAGEGSARLRGDVCEGLAPLGFSPLPTAPEEDSGDRVASFPGARPAVLVVIAREDLEIARAVWALLSG